AIHGHDLLGGVAQVSITIGFQPHFFFPCGGMYFGGLFTRFGIMSTKAQVWLEAAVIATSVTFALLITINRALAVSHPRSSEIIPVCSVLSQPTKTYSWSFIMTAEIIGLAIPIILMMFCGIFKIGNPILFQIAIISICFYPAFGSYFVLMSNTDYRNRIQSIFKRAQKATSLTRDQTDCITI
ncbi:unnamed protein product, partial [Auanema sp. JU1783]